MGAFFASCSSDSVTFAILSAHSGFIPPASALSLSSTVIYQPHLLTPLALLHQYPALPSAFVGKRFTERPVCCSLSIAEAQPLGKGQARKMTIRYLFRSASFWGCGA